MPTGRLTLPPVQLPISPPNLRAGELTAVWVPDEAHEALRDLVRLREDAIVDQKRARNRLGKFLRRQGWNPPEGTKAWSRAHREWLYSLWMELPAQRIVLRDDRRGSVDARQRRTTIGPE